MGICTSLPAPLLISLPAFDLSGLPETCPDCHAQSGLCGRTYCRRAVLPQLAQPRLFALAGDTHTEQKSRQVDRDPAISVEQADWRRRKEHARSAARAKGRKHARQVAKSQRRGAFGLAKQIARID